MTDEETAERVEAIGGEFKHLMEKLKAIEAEQATLHVKKETIGAALEKLKEELDVLAEKPGDNDDD